MEAIPPKLYGGTERVISWLTEELVALGHDVTLFASGDSQTAATLEPVWPKALRLDGAVRDANALHATMLGAFAEGQRVRRPALSPRLLSVLAVCAPAHAVSHYPARPARPAGASVGVPDVLVVAADLDLGFATASGAPCRMVRTVHHGLPERLLMPQPTRPSYLAFLGRISPEKGIDQAIRIAQRCGVPPRSPPRSTGSIKSISRPRFAG